MPNNPTGPGDGTNWFRLDLNTYFTPQPARTVTETVGSSVDVGTAAEVAHSMIHEAVNQLSGTPTAPATTELPLEQRLSLDHPGSGNQIFLTGRATARYLPGFWNARVSEGPHNRRRRLGVIYIDKFDCKLDGLPSGVTSEQLDLIKKLVQRVQRYLSPGPETMEFVGQDENIRRAVQNTQANLVAFNRQMQQIIWSINEQQALLLQQKQQLEQLEKQRQESGPRDFRKKIEEAFPDRKFTFQDQDGYWSIQWIVPEVTQTNELIRVFIGDVLVQITFDRAGAFRHLRAWSFASTIQDGDHQLPHAQKGGACCIQGPTIELLNKYLRNLDMMSLVLAVEGYVNTYDAQGGPYINLGEWAGSLGLRAVSCETNEELSPEELEGDSEPYAICNECGEHLDESDANYCDATEQYYCEECYPNTEDCDGCGNTFLMGDLRENHFGESCCTRCYRDTERCSECRDYQYTDELTSVRSDRTGDLHEDICPNCSTRVQQDNRAYQEEENQEEDE